MKKRNYLSLLILLISYILIRYVFINVHHMKQWPLILFIFTLVILFITLYFKKYLASFIISISYSLSFLIAYIFQKDGIDVHGTSTNNLWLIWLISLIVLIVISLIVDRKK